MIFRSIHVFNDLRILVINWKILMKSCFLPLINRVTAPTKYLHQNCLFKCIKTHQEHSLELHLRLLTIFRDSRQLELAKPWVFPNIPWVFPKKSSSLFKRMDDFFSKLSWFSLILRFSLEGKLKFEQNPVKNLINSGLFFGKYYCEFG